MKIVLPPSICSEQDLEALIFELHSYVRWFTHNNIKHIVDAKNAVRPPELSQAALTMVRDTTTGALLSQDHLDELITALDTYKTTAPSMTITLAAPVGPTLKATLTKWCRDNLSPDILVNFRFNATLLGGMVVQYGSRIFDWSFRRAILANRARFPEILRHV